MNDKDLLYDEKNGLWYERRGGYYIPCLILTEKEQKPIGLWGQCHLQYIKQNRRVFCTNLLTSGKLNDYLLELNEQAREIVMQQIL